MKKDFTTVWENSLQIIKDNVSLQSYKTWFEPITPVKLKDKVLTIQVPSQFFYEWLEEHYAGYKCRISIFPSRFKLYLTHVIINR